MALRFSSNQRTVGRRRGGGNSRLGRERRRELLDDIRALIDALGTEPERFKLVVSQALYQRIRPEHIAQLEAEYGKPVDVVEAK